MFGHFYFFLEMQSFSLTTEITTHDSSELPGACLVLVFFLLMVELIFCNYIETGLVMNEILLGTLIIQGLMLPTHSDTFHVRTGSVRRICQGASDIVM